uniref:Uncharacterized protein n=1 Tax=Glossina morsitans morsitans TaxID=37546 RepID=A0A1B0GEK6_GLOMM
MQSKSNNKCTSICKVNPIEHDQHQSQEAICASSKIKFWIPNIPQHVRSVSINCLLWKNLSTLPYIPLVRVLDRRTEERWVALFSCMTTRAIQLETAKND